MNLFEGADFPLNKRVVSVAAKEKAAGKEKPKKKKIAWDSHRNDKKGGVVRKQLGNNDAGCRLRRCPLNSPQEKHGS